jgi:hypothetical protein
MNYLDTKFKLTLPTSGPVVIVLSQLDDRYFRGLEGQYEFHLQFRLHKDDEDEYIVRSNAAYYMKRSVSTELTLDAGVYWVLLKITAKRHRDDPTVEEVIAKTCQFRPEKLLGIGLSYDLAHAKGNFLDLDADKVESEKLARRERRKATAKKMHEARIREHKKRKLRSLKMDMKKHERAVKKINQQVENQARQDAADAAAAKRFEDLKLQESEQQQQQQAKNGTGAGSDSSPLLKDTLNLTGSPKTMAADFHSTQPNGRTSSPQPVSTRQPSRSFSKPSSSYTLDMPPRRDTLSVATAALGGLAGFGTPGIRVQRAQVSAAGKLSLSDISDDDLSWDSELDAPSDTDSEAEAESATGGGGRHGDVQVHELSSDNDEDDEFMRDPWNAVCVVGLRAYAKKQEARIDVVRAVGGGRYGDGGQDGGEGEMSPTRMAQTSLDVDDAATDAVRNVRSPVGSPVRARARGVVGQMNERVMTWT